MIRLYTLIVMSFLPAQVWAKAYDRPIPQAQSATAEFWFFMASLLLVGALITVAWLVSKR
ncbi:protein NnrT [Rhodobacterales bacterium 56_14_T64]|nr:protein NnrT [Rhodobacterales bacterium 56_14_T64]